VKGKKDKKKRIFKEIITKTRHGEENQVGEGENKGDLILYARATTRSASRNAWLTDGRTERYHNKIDGRG